MDIIPTDKRVINAVGAVVFSLLKTNSHKATKYLSDKLVVNATRKLYQGKVMKKASIDIVLKIGKPNYAERKFIKLCKEAKQPFPLKYPQLKRIKNK